MDPPPPQSVLPVHPPPPDAATTIAMPPHANPPPQPVPSPAGRLVETDASATIPPTESNDPFTAAFAVATAAKRAARILQSVSTTQKNNALKELHRRLQESQATLVQANQADVEAARVSVTEGTLSEATFKRLDVVGPNGTKLQALLQGLDDVVQLPDPTNRITLATRLDQGLDLYRVTCPIGVLLIIFEARPEVVIQISALAIKSGNAVILKGGKEATRSLRALHGLVLEALTAANLPVEAVQLVEGREAIQALLEQDQAIDVVIPRGSNALVRHIKESTRIPVLGHADGICALYIDEEADMDQAVPIIVDAKTHYPAACNAVETVLIHAGIADQALAQLAPALFAAGVTLVCDEPSYTLLAQRGLLNDPVTNLPRVEKATPQSFRTEFLDLKLAIRIVPSMAVAIDHIHDHGSGHTDGILTRNPQTARTFLQSVDSAGVYWNASTRFADGFRYGFGAEIGVSTNRTHARGPVGLEGLVLYKYLLQGHGQVAAQYGKDHPYLHEPIKDVSLDMFQH